MKLNFTLTKEKRLRVSENRVLRRIRERKKQEDKESYKIRSS
jgi:hypothetical protein